MEKNNEVLYMENIGRAKEAVIFWKDSLKYWAEELGKSDIDSEAWEIALEGINRAKSSLEDAQNILKCGNWKEYMEYLVYGTINQETEVQA